MSKRSSQPWVEVVEASPPQQPPADADVISHLKAILESPQFRTSRRSQQLLRFLVENSTHGRRELLKERTIGLEVFSRPASYEPSEDSIVRVNATDLRKRLAQYYLDHGKSSVWIELPPGSYVPAFHRVADKQVLPVPEPVATARENRYGRWLSVALLCAATSTGIWYLNRPAPTPFDRFWEPVVHNSGRMLICSSTVAAIDLAPRLKSDLSAELSGNVHMIEVQPREIGYFPEMQLTKGNFLAIIAFSGVADRLQHSPEIRLRPEITLEDRRSRPAILIGAFSNPVAMDLNRELRYRFTRWREASSEGIEIVDQKHVSRPWRVEFGTNSNYDLKLDYALLTRVFDPSTHQVLIWAGGISQYGTQAAAEFATNPIYWADLAKTAPKDWERKNLQVVLETSILNRTPKTPKVVGTFFW